MIGIIDYGLGNIASLEYALSDLSAETIVSAKVDELQSCEKLILPGVGNAGFAMEELKKRNLVDFIKSTKKPVLGICLGMQLLFESSEETELPLLSSDTVNFSGLIKLKASSGRGKTRTENGSDCSADMGKELFELEFMVM